MQEGATVWNVSTHSRPKAAATAQDSMAKQIAVSTHSRPKAAAKLTDLMFDDDKVSTHSRPKAAASQKDRLRWLSHAFQHTAARRRLPFL